MSNSHKGKTILGLKWNFVNQFGVQFLNLLFSIFLARILSPTEYGLIAMVTVFTGLSGIFIDFGFGNALIYKKGVKSLDWSSIFWLNLFMGLFICGVFILLSGPISAFYKEDSIKNITILLSFNFLASAASITYIAQLKKKLNFKSIASINLVSIVLSGFIGIYLAMLDYKVWSLVAQRLANTYIKFILLLVVSRWIPQLKLSIQSIKGIFSYSSYLFFGRIMAYGSRNLDNLTIGKYLSSFDLGIYNRAYSFLMFPVLGISGAINSVMFPSYSQIRENLDQIRSIFNRATKMVSFVVFPLMLLFNLCAEEITWIVFGEKWIEMIPFLKLFAVLGINQTLISLNGPLYLALGQTRLDFKIGLFTQTINIIGILIGINWGLYGVIYGLYISSIINYFPVNYFIFKKISLTFNEYFAVLLPIIVMNGAIFGLVYWADSFLEFSHLINLIVKVLLYLTIYLALNHFVKIFNVKEIKNLVLKNEK